MSDVPDKRNPIEMERIMELFSEIYSCYFKVLRHILCSQNELTIQDIHNQISREGFEESLLSIIPKLESGAWNLFEKKGEIYISKISSDFIAPLSHLEKSYLKALLNDPRIKLFLNKKELEYLNHILFPISPLWKQEDFYYYDQFTGGDPYEDENYQNNFHLLVEGQKSKEFLNIDYTSPKGNRVHHYYVPLSLEYSVKNNKFRLLAVRKTGHGNMELQILNLDRIKSISHTGKFCTNPISLNEMIQNSYYKEPLTLHIKNQRNTLERAMLHFANYEKNTTKIDENTYECLIYYNQGMETELLIEVMSFGPMITVVGNDKLLYSLKKRLKRQLSLS